MPKKKTPINFISRDFESIKGDLVNYAKKYYPNTFKDFTDAGFGSLMIDSVAYVGDILSFYLDYQANETFIENAAEFNNVLKLAKQMGFKFQNNPSSNTILTFFILVPANSTGTAPDSNYIPILKQGTTVRSDAGGLFVLDEDINFINGETVVARVNETTGLPTFYAVKGSARAISGELKTTSVNVGDFERFRSLKLDFPNVNEIITIFDTDGHEYYQVDFLSQNTVYRAVTNRDTTTQQQANMILKPFIAPRRFTANFFPDNVEIQFGSGKEQDFETEQEINPKNVALNMNGKSYISDQDFDPSKLIKSDSYGVSPNNTTLTIQYRQNSVSNVNAAANSINTIVDSRMEFVDEANLSTSLVGSVVDSLEVTNDEPVVGDTENIDVEELRNRVINTFSSQYRAVTQQDYISLAHSMPAKFGSIMRASIVKDPESARRNMNMYVVGVDSNNNLSPCNFVTKSNLKTWLGRNKMINDTIDIMDARVLNLGIEFEIITENQNVSVDILQNCLVSLENRFAASPPDIGEDFFLSDVYDLLKSIPGVVDVTKVSVVNKHGSNYSSLSFDVDANISPDGRYLVIPKNVVYEIKFPSLDIRGAVR